MSGPCSKAYESYILKWTRNGDFNINFNHGEGQPMAEVGVGVRNECEGKAKEMN